MNKINVGQMMQSMNTLNPNWRGPQYVVAIYASNDGGHYLTAVDANSVPTSYKQTDDNRIKDVSSGAEYFNLMVINPTVVTNPAQINAALAAIRATADEQQVVAAAADELTYPVTTLEGVVDDILDSFTDDEKLFTSVDVTLEVCKRDGFKNTPHWQVRKEVAAWMDNNMFNCDYTTTQITVSGGNRATLYHPEDADASDYDNRNQTTKQGVVATGGIVNNGPLATVPTGCVVRNPEPITVDRQNDRIRIPKSVVRYAGYSPGDSVAIETVANGLLILPFKEDTSTDALTVTLDGRINVTEFWLHKANLLSSVNVRVTENTVMNELMIEIRG